MQPGGTETAKLTPANSKIVELSPVQLQEALSFLSVQNTEAAASTALLLVSFLSLLLNAAISFHIACVVFAAANKMNLRFR